MTPGVRSLFVRFPKTLNYFRNEAAVAGSEDDHVPPGSSVVRCSSHSETLGLDRHHVLDVETAFPALLLSGLTVTTLSPLIFQNSKSAQGLVGLKNLGNTVSAAGSPLIQLLLTAVLLIPASGPADTLPGNRQANTVLKYTEGPVCVRVCVCVWVCVYSNLITESWLWTMDQGQVPL